MKMKTILYISRGGLPIDAAGVRIYHIGDLLERAGYRLHYIADRRMGRAEKNSGYAQITEKLNSNDVHFCVGEKRYSYMPEKKSGKLDAFFEMWELRSARRIYRRVLSYCQQEKPEAIILYNDVGGLTRRLIPYCKKEGIRLYADVTEWYEYSNAKNIGEKLVARFVNRRILKTDKKLDGIIAIGPYLKKFYDAQGVPCIQIPPLMESFDLKSAERYRYNGMPVDTVNFVYAGSPGAKDLLLPFVKAVQRCNAKALKVRLDVIGIGSNYFDEIPEIDHDLESIGIFAHGRLSRAETLDFVRNADFGILFRHEKRYAKAGFSTKFAECMSLGVPMLCNPIGGCDSMIVHGENGFLTNGCEAKDLDLALQEIAAMSSDEILTMKKNAYAFAQVHFKNENYFEALTSFLKLKVL